ncbi:helix-turn-helix domain-containing protein [Vibrio parahaemolyticus]|uniref:helix-turn-helix domain-containing protein n=1 Tax=Vibrio parahaemolyticus TaxID=670 RepID=UPI000402D46E|nr:helix-turn-helix transcriptional regulator [Vibrio parahaemolyticus]
MSFQNPIPQRLKEARKKAKLSQKALGVQIGMDESSASPRMNQYEKGKHTPDVKTLKSLADVLGVPLNYFFCEDEKTAELATLINMMSYEEKCKLAVQLKNILIERDNGKI